MFHESCVMESKRRTLAVLEMPVYFLLFHDT